LEALKETKKEKTLLKICWPFSLWKKYWPIFHEWESPEPWEWRRNNHFILVMESLFSLQK